MNRQERRKLTKLAQSTPEELDRAYKLLRGGQIRPAAAIFTRLLSDKDKVAQAEAYRGLGTVALYQKDEGKAASYFRKAVAILPNYAAAWRDLGTSLAVLGDLEGAETALDHALALAPDMGDAQRYMAAIRGRAADTMEISALAVRAVDQSLPEAERIEIFFALGRYADARGAYDEAFRHFSTANTMLRATLARQGATFDRAQLAADVDRIIAAFPAGNFSFRGNESEAPVFILGMPRAGSSLFEQIAASHSQVLGDGEHGGIRDIVARLGWAPNARWTEAAMAHAAHEYLAARSRQAPRIIDKTPNNIFYLGLITALFPNARIIFCSRDIRDVALSCYFQRFSENYVFDTDISDCMFRCRQVDRLATHWQAALPLRHMVLSYETLLESPEPESRRLIDFLGLDWEPACLNFHETKRTVRTASWAQVRQPLYKHAIERWRSYTAYMPELLK